jgi:hypothetical protein
VGGVLSYDEVTAIRKKSKSERRRRPKCGSQLFRLGPVSFRSVGIF